MCEKKTYRDGSFEITEIRNIFKEVEEFHIHMIGYDDSVRGQISKKGGYDISVRWDKTMPWSYAGYRGRIDKAIKLAKEILYKELLANRKG